MPSPYLHIIDDDEALCSEMCYALVASGYDCSWATSADRLTGRDDRTPDILLLDLNLPRIDGFQIIRRLADEEYQPHLIVASGHEQRIIDAAVRCAEDAGLNVLGSLRKPYPIRSLLTLVEGFTAATRDKREEHATLVGELARSGELAQHRQTAFQSRRRLSDGAIVGYEALLRIAIDGLSVSPETVFGSGIELAAQLALTEAILDDALRFAADLRNAGTPASVSVNCTPAILCAPELPDMVVEALTRWQMPASSLLIEITEHAAAHSFDDVTTAACRLAMRDCGISIDDFGRGTTSLERLFDLPLAELKIDKQIFWKCVDGREPSGLLKEVLHYCENRNITSTIEGIETAAHRDHAVALGAQCGQGFLWDRPSFYARGSRRRSRGVPNRETLI